MTAPNFILAYVADAPKSAALYSKLLDAEPVESSPNWAMFAFPNGLALGLWSRDEVEPRATLPGGSEIGFPVDSDAAVKLTRDAWSGLASRSCRSRRRWTSATPSPPPTPTATACAFSAPARWLDTTLAQKASDAPV